MLPTFEKFLLREVTTGRVDQFLKRQLTVSYAHARHSRVVLSLMFNYALVGRRPRGHLKRPAHRAVRRERRPRVCRPVRCR